MKDFTHTHTHTQNPVAVMNYCMSGMHILHAIFVLLAKVIPMNVKAVVYIIAFNDFRASCMADGDYYTKHKTLSIFTKYREDPPKQKSDFTHFRKFIEDFWTICKIHNIRCIFAGTFFSPEDPRSAVTNEARKICESKNYEYVDLGECVKQYFLDSGKELSAEEFWKTVNSLTYDTTHLTAEGAAIVGKIMADELYSRLFETK